MAKFSIDKWRKKAISMYGKSRGLSKEQRKKVTAAVHKGTKRASKPSRKSNPKNLKGRKKSMAKKKKSRRRRSFTIPVAPVAGGAIGLVQGPLGGSVIGDVMKGSWGDATKQFIVNYSGFNAFSNKWEPSQAKGLWGLLIGTGIHVVASKLGLNRALGAARVPLIRI